MASTSATEVICTTPTLAGEAPVVALAPAAAAAAEAMARPTRKRKRNRNLTAAEAAAVAAVGSEAAREARAMRQRPRLRLGRRHVRGYTRPGARTGGGGVHTWTFPAVGSDQRGHPLLATVGCEKTACDALPWRTHLPGGGVTSSRLVTRRRCSPAGTPAPSLDCRVQWRGMEVGRDEIFCRNLFSYMLNANMLRTRGK